MTRRIGLLASCLPAALLFLMGCEQPIEGVVGTILPASETVEMRFRDDLAVSLTTQLIDSVPTYRAERQLVGNYVDPQMGRIAATTYTEVLARSGLDFGASTDLIYDSLVLRLAFDGAYGNVSEPLTLRVFELGDTLADPGSISSRSRTAYDDSQPLGAPKALQFATGSGNLRIRLDDELGRRILFADPAILGDRARFVDILKGLVLTTDPVPFLNKEPGAIYQMVLASDESQLELYYRKREPNTSAFQARLEPFVIGSSTPRYHQITRSEIDQKLLSTAYITPDTLTQWEFLQGGSLVQTLIKLPDVDQLGEVGISRAELILPVATTFFGGGGRFQPPAELQALLADEDGNVALNSDGLAQAIADAPISYNSSLARYTILLTRYVQSVVSEQQANHGFIIQPVSPTYRMRRAILGGTGNPDLAPQLRVTYSTLPE
jgi:hypothetical protein